jgi:hypothetical protein
MPRHSSYVYKGDIGARIVLNVKQRNGDPYSVATASTKTLKLTAPSGSTKSFTLAFATSPFGNGLGTDGAVEYVTTATSDLDESGRWTAQGFFVFSATDQRHTQPVVIHVGEVPS